MNDALFGFEAIAIFTTAISISVVLLWQTARSRRRTRELEAVKAALEAHYAAMDRILEDPALPKEALYLAATLSTIIADRQTAEWIGHEYVTGGLFSDRKKQKPGYFAELKELRKTRPELMDNFDTAIISALMALTLRWPESARVYQLILSKTLFDDGQKFQFAKRVVDHNDERRPNGGTMPSKDALAAC